MHRLVVQEWGMAKWEATRRGPSGSGREGEGFSPSAFLASSVAIVVIVGDWKHPLSH